MINGTHTDGSSTSWGSFYNQYATTAGGITSSSYSGEYIYNICAKNWTTPSVSEVNTLTALSVTASTFGVISLGAGYYTSTGPYATNNDYARMHFRTRTIMADRTYWNCMYTDAMTTNTVQLGNCHTTYGGFPVRCLAK